MKNIYLVLKNNVQTIIIIIGIMIALFFGNEIFTMIMQYQDSINPSNQNTFDDISNYFNK